MAQIKTGTALLKKPTAKDTSYTKTQLIAHLAEAVTAHGLGEVSKKQAAAFLEEYNNLIMLFAPIGANLPGLGKVVLRKVPKKPARMGRNPQNGEPMEIPAKPATKKLVFRFSKAGKEAAGLV